MGDIPCSWAFGKAGALYLHLGARIAQEVGEASRFTHFE
jgi:hypothetical protein